MLSFKFRNCKIILKRGNRIHSARTKNTFTKYIQIDIKQYSPLQFFGSNFSAPFDRSDSGLSADANVSRRGTDLEYSQTTRDRTRQ